MMVSAPAPHGRKKGGVLPWLFFPPTLLLPIVMLFYAIGEPTGRSGPPLPFVIFFGMIYIALSLAYCILTAKGNRKGGYAVALLANGALVVLLGSLMGGPSAAQWMGGILFLLGLICSMHLLSPPPSPRFAKGEEAILPTGTDRGVARQILDAIAFPAAFLEVGEDGVEWILTSNKPFASILGRGVDKTEGTLFSSFTFSDASWVARRETRGKQTLFMLSPREKTAEAPIVQVLDAIDRDTGLFTRKFLEYKGKSDVEGCCRYQRRLAVSLFRLSFGFHNGILLSEEARGAAFNVFGRMISDTIRDCDSAYRVGDSEILLFMPDTAPPGAKTAVSRIRERMRKLAAMECPTLEAAQLTEGTVGFFGKDARSLDHVIEQAYLAIGRQDDLKDMLHEGSAN